MKTVVVTTQRSGVSIELIELLIIWLDDQIQHYVSVDCASLMQENATKSENKEFNVRLSFVQFKNARLVEDIM